MTDREKERIIANVNANMTAEDMPLTRSNLVEAYDILNGKITTEEAINDTIQRYRER